MLGQQTGYTLRITDQTNVHMCHHATNQGNNRFTLRETLFLLVRQLAKQHGPTVTAGDLCQRQRFDMTRVYELRWIRW